MISEWKSGGAGQEGKEGEGRLAGSSCITSSSVPHNYRTVPEYDGYHVEGLSTQTVTWEETKVQETGVVEVLDLSNSTD